MPCTIRNAIQIEGAARQCAGTLRQIAIKRFFNWKGSMAKQTYAERNRKQRDRQRELLFHTCVFVWSNE